jgi:transposase
MKAALSQLVRSPSTPQGVVQRSRIVLAAAAGKSNQQIAGELHMPEVTVGKWRRSFAQQGLRGLEDAPRSGRPVIHGAEIVQRVQTRVCEQPEHYDNTPAHASWVNMVECFFSIMGKQALSQSVHTSRRQLKEFLLDYIARNNKNPRPFVWTKGPEKLQRIIEATKQYQAAHPRKPRKRRGRVIL